MGATTLPNNSSYSYLYFLVSMSVIQSSVLICAALFGIQVYECRIDIPSFSFHRENYSWCEAVIYQTYLTYFRGECSRFQPEDGWFSTCQAGPRMYKWMIFYIIIGSLWMVASFFLFMFTSTKEKFTRGGLLCGYLWMCATSLVLCTDVFGSVQYLLDIWQIYKMDNFYHFIGLDVNAAFSAPRFINSISSYASPILMSLIFCKGVIFWIMNLFLVVSFRKRFRNGKVIQQGRRECHENAIILQADTVSKMSSTSAQSTSIADEVQGENPSDQNYTPWMNVLYLPSIYEDNNAEKITAEHYDEHHYEHVTCYPRDASNGIKIEIPAAIRNEMKAGGCQDNADPNLLKIDVGNVCVKISQKNNNSNLFLPSNYQNVHLMKIPRVSGLCSASNCGIHRVFREMSAVNSDRTT